MTAALTSLAADVKALQETLATAATAAEVAALQTALTAAQSDLTELLASNNVYSESVVINSASSLSVYEALGDKLKIVNGSVTVTQSSTDIDSAKLQTVLDKMITVTGDVSYTQSGVGVTAVDFNNLTGVSTITFDVEAPISLPELVTASNIVVTADSKLTSFSAPKLTTVTTIKTGSTQGLKLSASATSVDLSSLVNVTGQALTIETKSSGTVDLSVLSPIVASTGKSDTNFALILAGPKEISLPEYITGALTTDAEKVTLVKFKNAPTFTGTDNLEELHMHAVETSLVAALSGETNISILDIIGVIPTTGPTDTVKGQSLVNITITNASELTELTLAGNIGAVSLASASDLSSVTTSGGIKSFSLAGATDLSELTLGHGPSPTATLKQSDLVITGATNLTSITADSVNYANTLTISGNTELASISLDGLTAISTNLDTADKALKPSVTISGNNLDATSFQLPSEVDTTPVVAGSISTESGLDTLKTYLDKAVAATGAVVSVQYDDVAQIVEADGTVTDVDGTPKSVTYATAKDVTVTVGDAFKVIDIKANDIVYENSEAARKQTNTMSLNNSSVLSDMSSANTTFQFNPDGGAVDVSLEMTSTFRAGITGYDREDITTWAPAVATAMEEKIAAAGYNYSFKAYQDYGRTAVYTFDLISSTTGGLDNTDSAIVAGKTITVTGLGSTVTAMVVAASGASNIAFTTAVVSAIERIGSPISNVWSATANGDGTMDLIRTRTAKNTQDFAYESYPTIDFSAGTSSNITSSALLSGADVRARKVESVGYRFTAINNETAFNAAKLQAGMTFFSESDNATSGTITFTAVDASAQWGTATSTLQVDFDEVTPGAVGTVASGSAAATTDFTAWM